MHINEYSADHEHHHGISCCCMPANSVHSNIKNCGRMDFAQYFISFINLGFNKAGLSL